MLGQIANVGARQNKCQTALDLLGPRTAAGRLEGFDRTDKAVWVLNAIARLKLC